MTDNHIITGQYVRIEQTPAAMSLRFWGYVIDLLTCLAYVLLFSWGTKSLGWSISWAETILLEVLPILIYQPVLESLCGGQTLGKYLLRTRVVRIDGTSPSMGDFLLRWLLMPVDIFFFGAVAAFSMLITPRRQRLGDLAAGTMVIRLNNYDKIRVHLDEFRFVRDGYEPTFSEARSLSEEQATRIARTLADRSSSRNNRITQLARELRSSLQIDLQHYYDDEHLLSDLLSDYRFFEMSNNI